jgi:hypothetical protein
MIKNAIYYSVLIHFVADANVLLFVGTTITFSEIHIKQSHILTQGLINNIRNLSKQTSIVCLIIHTGILSFAAFQDTEY